MYVPVVERDVGGLGEATLSLWSRQTGIACQKVSDDKTGWDYLLELSSSASEVRLENQPPKIAAFIQVKSSDTTPGKAQVKLDTLADLTRRSAPVFFLFLEFGGDPQPDKAYLVHLG